MRAAQFHEEVVRAIYDFGHEELHLLVADLTQRVHVFLRDRLNTAWNFRNGVQHGLRGVLRGGTGLEVPILNRL